MKPLVIWVPRPVVSGKNTSSISEAVIEKARERVLLLGCSVGVSGIEAAYTTDLLYVP